jgi:formyltetrahydrofolate synthetase
LYNATATADCSKTGDGAIRITRVVKSNNYYLRSITTDVGEWDNDYNPRNTDYIITVDPHDDFVTFFGTKYEDEQEVVGLGKVDLEVGENYHTISVTSVSGDTRVYNFTIVRQGISPSTLLYKIVIDGQ